MVPKNQIKVAELQDVPVAMRTSIANRAQPLSDGCALSGLEHKGRLGLGPDQGQTPCQEPLFHSARGVPIPQCVGPIGNHLTVGPIDLVSGPKVWLLCNAHAPEGRGSCLTLAKDDCPKGDRTEQPCQNEQLVEPGKGIRKWQNQSIRRASIITRQPLTTTPPHIIIIRPSITTRSASMKKPSNMQLRLTNIANLLTNIPRPPTLILISDGATTA